MSGASSETEAPRCVETIALTMCRVSPRTPSSRSATDIVSVVSLGYALLVLAAHCDATDAGEAEYCLLCSERHRGCNREGRVARARQRVKECSSVCGSCEGR